MYSRGIAEKLWDSSKLTDVKSQREDFYVTNEYIAEWYACISNVGFLLVGVYFMQFSLFLAGICSILSHAIPWQSLLTLDKVAAIIACVDLLHNYENIYKYKLIIGPFILFAISEIYISRKYNFSKYRITPHVLWHLGAAAVAALILS